VGIEQTIGNLGGSVGSFNTDAFEPADILINHGLNQAQVMPVLHYVEPPVAGGNPFFSCEIGNFTDADLDFGILEGRLIKLAPWTDLTFS
jgi:hypothetical protein